MKLTIEPTNEITQLSAGPCRVWRGTAENGGTVFVFTRFVAIAENAPAADHEAFDRELVRTAEPTVLEVIAGASDAS